MVNRDQDYHERDPHFDGRNEGVLNDNRVEGGGQMGVRTDMNPENLIQPKNPFHMNPSKQDKELERFEELMKGEEKGRT
ncbi:hypothetical protein LCL95_01860 [Bacillus timonensis]|nr:hypothetical protein [Bacillus timonensis]